MGVLWVWLSVTGFHMGVAFCGDAALLHDETDDNQLVSQPRLSPAQQAIRATTRRDLAASRTCAKWAQINDNVPAIGIGPHRRSNRVGKKGKYQHSKQKLCSLVRVFLLFLFLSFSEFQPKFNFGFMGPRRPGSEYFEATCSAPALSGSLRFHQGHCV